MAYHKNKFSTTLPENEYTILQSASHKNRQRYYVHVSTSRKNGLEPMFPSQFYAAYPNMQLMSFTEIARRLQLPVPIVRMAYTTGMKKLFAGLKPYV